MKDSGITWKDAALDEYLANPAKKIPGNRMTYLGVRKPEDRRDVIAYIEAESKK
jgi:cytochrome c